MSGFKKTLRMRFRIIYWAKFMAQERTISKLKVRNLADYGRITQAARGAALVRTDRGYFIVKEDGKKGQKR